MRCKHLAAVNVAAGRERCPCGAVRKWLGCWGPWERLEPEDVVAVAAILSMALPADPDRGEPIADLQKRFRALVLADHCSCNVDGAPCHYCSDVMRLETELARRRP